MNTINSVNKELKKLPNKYPNREYLISKTKYENKSLIKKFETIRSKYKVDNFTLIGDIVINLKKFDAMGCYDYFNDDNNFYDLSKNENYEKFITLLSSATQVKSKISVEKVITPPYELIEKYMLQNFSEKLQSFYSLSPVDQGELLYNIKNIIKNSFVSFYKEFGIDKSKVSIRIKLYELSLEFVEFRDLIQNLKIGIVGCLPKDNYALRNDILQKISSGELKQDRNEIKNFINQTKFTDKEQELDNNLIKLKSYLDKKKYSKLSDNDQQRILNHFNKIEKIIKKEG